MKPAPPVTRTLMRPAVQCPIPAGGRSSGSRRPHSASRCCLWGLPSAPGPRLADGTAQVEPLDAGDHRGAGYRLGDQFVEGDALEVEPESPGLDARQLEEVVDEPGEPVDLAPHRAVVAHHRLGFVDHAVL